MSDVAAYQFYVAHHTKEPSRRVEVMAYPNGEAGIFTAAFFDALVGKRLQVIHTIFHTPQNRGWSAHITAWSIAARSFIYFDLDATPPYRWTGFQPGKALSGTESLWVWLIDPYRHA